MASRSGEGVEEFASGWLTPLMLTAREGDVESARLLVAAGADVNAIAGDGKVALRFDHPPPELHEKAAAAARHCPTRAIKIGQR